MAAFTRKNGERNPQLRRALVGGLLLVLGGSVPLLLDPRTLMALSGESLLREASERLPSISGAWTATEAAYSAIARDPGRRASRSRLPASSASEPARSTPAPPQVTQPVVIPDLDFSSARMRFLPILTEPESIPREVPLPEIRRSPASVPPPASSVDFSQARSLFHGDPQLRAPSGIAVPKDPPAAGGRAVDEQPAGAVPPVPGR